MQLVGRRREGLVCFTLLVACVSGAAGPAGASVSVDAPATTYTGASFFASATASDAPSVVLAEWDFDGDGSFDFNSTNSLDAGHTFASTGTFVVRVQVTRFSNNSSATENATRFVTVLDGRPSVEIDVPDRAVARLPQRFVARATDPDPSAGGEPFVYRWTLNGDVVGGQGAEATLTAQNSGRFEVAVEATDAEGLTTRATTMVVFAEPGPFEGRQGMVNLSAAVALAALGAGLFLVRARRVEDRAAKLKETESTALAVETVSAEAARASGPPPKLAFGAASTEAAGSAPRIAIGGSPAALLHTRECPVCHNAIDADVADCPFCAANQQAEDVARRIEGDAFAGADLSDVRALLSRARRERHLGRLDVNQSLLKEAGARAEELARERDDAVEAMARARDAFAAASRGGRSEAVERAESYLKLADSLFTAHQNGKAARHARRVVELLSQGGGEAPTSDRCHACGGPLAAAIATGADTCPHCGASLRDEARATEQAPPAELEGRVRDEIRAIRADAGAGGVDVDEETWKLLSSAEAFEKAAEWGQALEILRTLRERLERGRTLSAPGEDPPGDPRPGPP
jgi:uncharacterized Zn finger protein (UPF0148 family)